MTRSKTSSSSSLKLSLQETRVEKEDAVARPKPGLPPLPAKRCKQLSDFDLEIKYNDLSSLGFVTLGNHIGCGHVPFNFLN